MAVSRLWTEVQVVAGGCTHLYVCALRRVGASATLAPGGRSDDPVHVGPRFFGSYNVN